MTEQENNITIWSDKILQTLLEYRTKEPNLKFWLRQRNTNNRLDDGLWFNGNNDYIHIGFSKLGAGNLSTQSIGFVIDLGDAAQIESRIEITFRDEKDKDILACYNRMVEEIEGIIKVNEKQYFKSYVSKNPLQNLEEFLTVQKPQIDSIIKQMGLEDKMNIPEETFEKSLKKIIKKRDDKQLLQSIQWLKSLGTLGLVVGVLGQLIGLFSAFSVIETSQGISPTMLASGLKVSMITTLYGLIIYITYILFSMILKRVK